MTTMSTKKLAMRLGLLRKRSQAASDSKKSLISNQIFSYLIVIDFESTCWREKNNYSHEIIEFPAVLLNTSTGEVESEFHTYVQPQERPILSEFCTELTGITQGQVEAGVPLHICLSRFSRWLQKLQLEMGAVFPKKQEMDSVASPSQKLCTFLTWSDWDLGVCLQYECKRKQLPKPDVLNTWIDLRSTYRLFYNRKPKGLNGALQDLGIQFTGREHSGLDDARNTAQLAARMMRDGCVMKVTRSLERTPAVARAMFGNASHSADEKDKQNINEKENEITTNKLLSSKDPLKAFQKQSCLKDVTWNSDVEGNSSPAQESVQACQSLIFPKTLLNDTAAPLQGHIIRPVTGYASNSLSSADVTNCTSTHNNTIHVLCSTTVSCFSNLHQPNQDSKTGLDNGEEEGELLVETEERCGSYDNVVLACDDDLNGIEDGCETEYVSDFDGGCREWEESNDFTSRESHGTLECNLREAVSAQYDSQMQKSARDSSKTCQFRNSVNAAKPENSDSCFAVPKAVNWGKLNQRKTGLLTFPQPLGRHKNKSNVPPPVVHRPLGPEKMSTPYTCSAKPKPIIMNHSEQRKSSFTIYTEPTRQTAGSSRPSSASLLTPKNVLSSLSANTLSCSRRSNASVAMKGPPKITSPLCSCGRRAKRQVVSNGGPNHGRGFYCCPVRRSGSRGRMEKGCEFFKWESALIKNSSVANPAVGSSISLCQVSSTPSHWAPHRAQLRKSY